MSRPTLWLVIACLATVAGPAQAQLSRAAPGAWSPPPGSVGAKVSTLSTLSGSAPASSPASGGSAQGRPAAPQALLGAPAEAPGGNVQFAAPPRRPGAHPAVVRVVAPGRGSISYGSGSLVAVNERHGLVITNWHVINEATGQITVEFPDGFESPATVQKIDRDWDLAALAIWRPEVAPLPVAREAPRQGEMLTIAGYGSGKYRAASGVCTQYVAPGLKFPYEMVELAAAARQGDSGGPILNSRGELAGVLFGEGQGRTAGSYCGRVQWFLDSLIRDPRSNLGEALAQVSRPPAAASPAVASPAATAPMSVATSAAAPPPLAASPAAQPAARGESLPIVVSPGSAGARDTDRDSGLARVIQPAAAAPRAPSERPLDVVSLGKRPGGPSVADVAAGAPGGQAAAATALGASPAVPASDPFAERLAQIKAFLGAVATVGVLLLIVRSLGR